MTDRISKAHRSWNMSRIKGKNTRPEQILRSLLHGAGLRFRLHQKGLPGKPDIVLPKYQTVIFVHGCFWHRHARCRFAYTPKSRIPFWTKKFEENMLRDARTRRALRKMLWHVVVVWECQIERRPAALAAAIIARIRKRAETG